MQIVCHAFPAWEGNYLKSTVELVKQLARRGHTVLYVDYAFTVKDLIFSILGKNSAPWKRMIGLAPRLRKIPVPGSGCIYVLSLPPVLPLNFIKNPQLFDVLNGLQGFVIRRSIGRAMRRLGFDKPLYVNAFNPVNGLHVVDKLPFSKRIYYCYDEISAAHWAGRHGARHEPEFVHKCDGVVVSSEGLRTKMSALHPRVSVVHNGVDYEAFSRPVPAAQLPLIPGATPGRRLIGYVGSIDDRLDYAVLERLFRAFPEHLFVFIGRISTPEIREKLVSFANVYLAGAHPAAELPGWVRQMDVCLIPFVKNKFTEAIYPLKINEYLAAGKPVVTTPFAPLTEFESAVYIADSENFLNAVKSALNNEKYVDFQQFARKNDWSVKAESLEKILLA